MKLALPWNVFRLILMSFIDGYHKSQQWGQFNHPYLYNSVLLLIMHVLMKLALPWHAFSINFNVFY